MVIAPDHIKDFVTPLSEKKQSRYFDLYLHDFAFAYELHCDCGRIDFYVYKTDEPMVMAQCVNCKKEIVVYDLAQYPCASTFRSSKDEWKQIENGGDTIFLVGILFEYSDEFALDDCEFDVNDLSWCQIFLHNKRNQKAFCIVNDETS